MGKRVQAKQRTLADVRAEKVKQEKQQKKITEARVKAERAAVSEAISNSSRRELYEARAARNSSATSSQRKKFEALDKNYLKEDRKILDWMLKEAKNSADLISFKKEINTFGSKAQKELWAKRYAFFNGIQHETEASRAAVARVQQFNGEFFGVLDPIKPANTEARHKQLQGAYNEVFGAMTEEQVKAAEELARSVAKPSVPERLIPPVEPKELTPGEIYQEGFQSGFKKGRKGVQNVTNVVNISFEDKTEITNNVTKNVTKNVNKRLGNIEGRLTGIEGTLGNIDSRLGTMKGTLGNINGRLNGIEGSIGNVNKKLGGIEKTIGQLGSRMDQLGQTLDQVKEGQDAIKAGQEAILKGQRLNRRLGIAGVAALAGLWLLSKCSGDDKKQPAEEAVAGQPNPAQGTPARTTDQGAEESQGSVSLPAGLVPDVTLPKVEIPEVPEIPEDMEFGGEDVEDGVTPEGEKPTSYKAAPYKVGIWNIVKDHYLKDYKQEVDAIKAYYKEQKGKDAQENTIIRAFTRAICDKMGIDYFAEKQTKPQYMQEVRVDDIDMDLVKKYLFE